MHETQAAREENDSEVKGETQRQRAERDRLQKMCSAAKFHGGLGASAEECRNFAGNS